MINVKKIFIIVCFMMMNVGLAYSNVETGGLAPNFTLADTKEVSRSLSDFKGKYVVLEWVNYDCPFVRKHYDSGNMQSLQKKFTDQGVVWLSIVSSAEGKQGYYSDEKLNELAKIKGSHPTVILADRKGEVGRLYGAKTTPHMFVVDPEGRLIYQGAIDSIAGFEVEEIKGAENYINTVLGSALSGEKFELLTTKPYGCSVKY